jgi:hypothetical protein
LWSYIKDKVTEVEDKIVLVAKTKERRIVTAGEYLFEENIA